MFFAANTLMYAGVISISIVFWLFCMYSTANIARANGANTTLWMTIGLLTGPVGLAFAWVYFRFTGERHKRIRHGAGHKYDMPEIIRCPGCGQSVPSAYATCQFCRAPLHGRQK